MSPAENPATREQVRREAADWFVANREGLTTSQRQQFASWLRRSAIHVEEYLRTLQLACDLRQAVIDPEVSVDSLIERARRELRSKVRSITPHGDASGLSPELVPGTLQAPGALHVASSRWRRAVLAVAAALAVVAVAGIAWQSIRTSPGPAPPAILVHFATRHGEQLTQKLQDGTVLHLNTDSSVTVRYTGRERHVEVESGQAAFEVIHSPTRPFRVFSGTTEVTDWGTKFEVYRQPAAIVVTVLEGRVVVSPTDASAVRGATALLVTTGQRLRIAPGEWPSGAVPIDAQRASAWLNKKIVFEREPLVAVAAEFNRYAVRPIEIETPALRQISITGTFAEDDVESFIAFLRSLDGVRVEVTPDRIRVYSS
jgi:transmembrane sensor